MTPVKFGKNLISCYSLKLLKIIKYIESQASESREERIRVCGFTETLFFNPLTPDIKEQILLSFLHTFLIKVPGRSY